METRANYALIGSAVLIVVALALLFVLRMTQQGAEFDEYDVVFNERVSGLSIGSIVRFNGIQVGEVTDLSIDPKNPGIVIARVKVDNQIPIRTDTKAELEFVGFTGLAIIQFVGDSPDAPLLKDQETEYDVPRIEADTSGFAAFLSGSGDLVTKAQRILSDQNIENISAIVADIEQATSVIAANKDDIAAILENTGAASEDLAEISDSLRKAATGLEDMLAERGPDAMEDAERLLEESRGLVAELRGVVDENRGSLRAFADQGLGQVAPALAEARRLMRTLDYMLREIDRDPQAYFLGETAPEYGDEDQ